VYIEDFCVTIELGFEDDFWDSRDSVFINGLSVRSSLFAQMMQPYYSIVSPTFN